MAITLEKVFAGISDYVNKHESNYTILEDSVNDILNIVGGSSSSSVVPVGLQEIFDRNGVIGIGSYQLTDQTVVGDNLSIPAGSAWMALSFRTASGSTSLGPDVLSTGTRYLDIDSAGLPNLSATQTADSIYSFSWDFSTKVISNSTLLIDILFDGDDYNDSLTSTVLATNYTSMADRFEAIEASLGVIGALYAQDTGTTTGLTFGYQSGIVRNDNVVSNTAAGTIALTDATVNYIEVTPSTGVITTNTTGYTSLRVPLFQVTTSGGAITVVTDDRTWAALGGGGGGGGHTQNTDTGTDSAEFKLLNTVTGAPSSNGSFKVERGTSADVDVRWNETTDQWEFTNDGSIYNPLGAPDLGQQELCKCITFEDPPAVVNITGHTTDSGYVKVDLTADPDFTSIVNGVGGMLLRVQYDDSAPSASTNVKFRRIENPTYSPTESLRVYAIDSADFNDNEGRTIMVQGEGLAAPATLKIGFEYLATTSGSGTANLKVFVLGYWEKVTGVGTQQLSFEVTGNGPIATTTTDQFNLTGFMNRGLIHSISFEETGGSVTSNYNVKFYGKDTFLAADLQYQLDSIDPSVGPPNVTDTLPLFYEDKDGTQELHMSIENTDATFTGTYTVTIEAERFA